MPTEETRSLDLLNKMLAERGNDNLYPCIQDLVEHGLDLARFADGEMPPHRQVITQYLAAWSMHSGLSEEETSGWLVDFCAVQLAPLSKRTPAALRHSTKSNVRYVYRSTVPFLCQCANNLFRAHCHPDCQVYADMQAKLQAKAIELAQPKPVVEPAAPVAMSLSVKAVNLEQFQTGLSLARDEVSKGTKIRRIVALLNDRGLKTRTGREWTYSILRNELLALDASLVPPQGSDKSGSPPEPFNSEQSI